MEEGQEVAITASGQVQGCHGPREDWAFGPWGPEGGAATAPDRTGELVCALVGMIEGADATHEFLVGRSQSLDAPLSGRLYLGVSDTIHRDNVGAFVVEVKIDGKASDVKGPGPVAPSRGSLP